MLIDMHNHTNVSSPCSTLSPRELILGAMHSGLDGLCVTEHFRMAGAEAARREGLRMGFPVFRGIEARSEWGDMLVYGYYRDIPEGIPHRRLCEMVHEAGGLVFAAHPFRVGAIDLYTTFSLRGLDLETHWKRVLFPGALDGIETLNGQTDLRSNARAKSLARLMKLPGIGGSDAHGESMIGRAATRFEGVIRSDEDLVEALKTGAYRAEALSPWLSFRSPRW